MTQDEVILKPFSLGGYRSFGDKVQRFEKFSKINLFIGQNNSGKSNILRFIHDVYPHLPEGRALKLNPLDHHFPSRARFIAGISTSLQIDEDRNYKQFTNEILPKFKEHLRKSSVPGYALRVFLEKAKRDGTTDVWFDYGEDKKLIADDWDDVFKVLNDREIMNLWHGLTSGANGGSRERDWYPQSINLLKASFPKIESVLIPAIRQIGEQGSISEDFSGKGIIERLVKLQNPDVHNQADKKKFEQINVFLQNVTDNTSATIEIPHERDTIHVHMDGKTLPLESLGTGIHEVIILASAATVLDRTVICMEEPELHLNPILQKKLVRYLQSNTTNQYFITTHSAALMDTPDSEVYHVNLVDGQSIIERVTSDRHRSAVCEDLGYHPSDLLQSNCVIWVEGPSDRIYLNHWINGLAPQYVEGIHYSIMFYGGRLAAHLSGNDVDELMDDFISLRRMNRKGVVIIDSDREKKGTRINNTKKRLRDEFDRGPGFAWITDGREIENYLAPDSVRSAIQAVSPSAKPISEFGKYANRLSVQTKRGKKSQVPKVSVARYIVSNNEPDFSQLDLGKQMSRLIAFIRESNPSLHTLGVNQ